MNVRAALESEIDHLARLWFGGWRDAHAEINHAETQDGPFLLETWRHEKSLLPE
jgi:hypothetical protein